MKVGFIKSSLAYLGLTLDSKFEPIFTSPERESRTPQLGIYHNYVQTKKRFFVERIGMVSQTITNDYLPYINGNELALLCLITLFLLEILSFQMIT